MNGPNKYSNQCTQNFLELAALAFHKERQGGVRSTLLPFGVLAYADTIAAMTSLSSYKCSCKEADRIKEPIKWIQDVPQ